MKNKKYIFLLIIFAIYTILFFLYNVYFSGDSSEYYYLSNIISGDIPWSQWWSYRGLTFPLVIRIIRFFGESHYTFLFFFYLISLINNFLIYLILKNIDNNYFEKGKYLKITLFFIFFTFNPIIYVYNHLVLTEILSITILLISELIFVKIMKNNKVSILNVIFLFIILCISIHLKRSTLITLIILYLIVLIYLIIKNHSLKQLKNTVLIIFVNIAGLLLINSVWNIFLKNNSINNVIEEKIEYRINISINNMLSVDDNSFNSKNKCYNIVNDNKVVDHYCINNNLNYSKNVKKLYFYVLINHPFLVAKNYLKLYLITIDLIDEKTGKISIIEGENGDFIRTIFSSHDRYWWDTYEGSKRISSYTKIMHNYELKQKSYYPLNVILIFIGIIYNQFFKIMYLFLPIIIIIIIINNVTQKSFLNAIQIKLLVTSFITLLFLTLAGASLDRYLIPTYFYLLICTYIYVNELVIKLEQKIKEM